MSTPLYRHKKRWSSVQLLHWSADVCESSAQPPSPLQTNVLRMHLDPSRQANWSEEQVWEMSQDCSSYPSSQLTRPSHWNLILAQILTPYTATGNGGHQCNCYTDWESCGNYHDNHHNRCKCLLWQCAQTHPCKRIFLEEHDCEGISSRRAGWVQRERVMRRTGNRLKRFVAMVSLPSTLSRWSNMLVVDNFWSS